MGWLSELSSIVCQLLLELFLICQVKFDFCHVMLCKRSPCRHAVSVCVCPSRSRILSKRINISSKFFHRRVATPFYFFACQIYSDGKPLTGVSNASGVDRNRDSEPTSGFSAWCNMPCVVNTVAGGPRPPFHKLWHIAGAAVDCRRRRRNAYDKKPQRYAKDNRTAHLTARSDKSVAYVTNNKILDSTFCTVVANYWQTRSIARPLCDSRATCHCIGTCIPPKEFRPGLQCLEAIPNISIALVWFQPITCCASPITMRQLLNRIGCWHQLMRRGSSRNGDGMISAVRCYFFRPK